MYVRMYVLREFPMFSERCSDGANDSECGLMIEEEEEEEEEEDDDEE